MQYAPGESPGELARKEVALQATRKEGVSREEARVEARDARLRYLEERCAEADRMRAYERACQGTYG